MAKYRVGDRYDRDELCHKSWEDLYGNTLEANLSQNVKAHIGNIWKPCPYSTQAVIVLSEKYLSYQETYGAIDIHKYIKSMLGVVPNLVDHTLSNGKVVYLKYAYRGVWGFECTFPGCTYLAENNKRYFYV